MSESESSTPPYIEFDDYLVNLFWKLHRFSCLQWFVLLLIRIREKLDIHKFIKKPITKEVDEMDNCHFRTLYKRNHFNDNFTDPDFLCSMQLNTNLNYYTLGEAISATIRVALQMCPCILYFIMYYHLSYGKISPEAVFGISLGCILFGYGLLQWCNLCSSSSRNNNPTVVLSWGASITQKLSILWNDSLVFLCCGALSYLLVPILRTVTQTIDTRTVYAVCAIMFGAHLFCNDYGLKVALVSTALSMNSAIFSVICLASRLQTDDHCLALISFGVSNFICYPQWSKIIALQFHRWRLSASLLLMAIVTAAGCTISWGIAMFIIALMLMIVVVAPILYVCYVQYKLNILGPWDEARPVLHVDMEEIEKGFEIRRSKRENSSEESIHRVRVRESKVKVSLDTEVKDKENEETIAELEAKGIGLVL